MSRLVLFFNRTRLTPGCKKVYYNLYQLQRNHGKVFQWTSSPNCRSVGVQQNHGRGGSFFQVCGFHSNEDELWGRRGGTNVFQACSEVLGSSIEHHFRKRYEVHQEVLDNTVQACQNEVVDELQLPSIDRWIEERINGVLEDYLRHYVRMDQANWPDLLDVVQFSYNL
jgi:hypothetical protein